MATIGSLQLTHMIKLVFVRRAILVVRNEIER